MMTPHSLLTVRPLREEQYPRIEELTEQWQCSLSNDQKIDKKLLENIKEALRDIWGCIQFLKEPYNHDANVYVCYDQTSTPDDAKVVGLLFLENIRASNTQADVAIEALIDHPDTACNDLLQEKRAEIQDALMRHAIGVASSLQRGLLMCSDPGMDGLCARFTFSKCNPLTLHLSADQIRNLMQFQTDA